MIPLTFSDVDDTKAEGNAEFQKGNHEKAIGKYQDAIQIISKIQVSTNDQNKAAILEVTLTANIAMCRLNQCELKTNASTLQPLFHIIEDITSAISILDKVTASDTKELRSKLLYRRSKSRHTLAMKHTMLQAPSIGNMELIQLCTNAQADLQSLLSFDSSNKSATALMQRMKVDTVIMMKESGISSSSSSPICSALNNLLDISKGNLSSKVLNFEKILQSLKFVHASILDDVTNASHELLNDEMRGGKILVNIGFEGACVGKDGGDELQVLAIQCLSAACAYPTFTALLITFLDTKFGGNLESKIFDIVSSETYSPNLINGVLSLQMRLIVHNHVKEDDDNYNRDGRELVKERDSHKNEDQTRICSAALESKHEECRSMGLNLLAAWLEENPLNIINASAGDDNRIAYSKVKEPLEDQVRQMVPRDLAEYRKSSAQRNTCRKERSRNNAIIFCNSGGLNILLSSAANSDQGFWRRDCILNTGRLMNHVRDDTAPRGDDNLSVDELTKNILTKFFAEKEHRLTIEEVDDGEEDADKTGGDIEIVRCMKRCLFATSLLLANGEMGAWTLKEIWNNARSEWEHLASSNNYAAMSAASEFASAAAGEKETRPWISSCVDATSADGVWRKLLSCDDREVRSGAASAMAKLGLADKSVSSDDGELIALLDVAAGLLEEDESASPSVKDSSSTGSYRAPMERGVELLSYLSSKTLVKDEIAHGFGFSVSTSVAGEPSSILDKVVKLSDPKSEVSPAIKFALASIFASLAVTIETLRREAFEGQEITLEQYDDLQAMGKPEEERKMEESKKDSDTPDALASRIKVMAKHHIPQALVKLIHNATEGTSEQVVTALSRMACEQAVRGSMIQQGCLSVCIQMSKTGELSSKQKKIVRLSQHTIAKILVTTNPTLLNTTQCMGSIQPLLMLVRDDESSDLQKFEALLSITNLASFNQNTQQHIIAEKGIPALSYAMFSNHKMVRRAATEAMSNLIPHPKMVEHLRDHDKLKVWVAFASDFEDNFECARAALGCLAMVSQDQLVADALLQTGNAEPMIKAVLESGNLELMHRVLVVVINLMEHGGRCKDMVVSSGTAAFCEAYVNSYQNGQDLEFSEADIKSMVVTIDLAKEVVLAYKK